MEATRQAPQLDRSIGAVVGRLIKNGWRDYLTQVLGHQAANAWLAQEAKVTALTLPIVEVG